MFAHGHLAAVCVACQATGNVVQLGRRCLVKHAWRVLRHDDRRALGALLKCAHQIWLACRVIVRPRQTQMDTVGNQWHAFIDQKPHLVALVHGRQLLQVNARPMANFQKPRLGFVVWAIGQSLCHCFFPLPSLTFLRKNDGMTDSLTWVS